MRFYNYLNESRTKEINKEEAFKIITEKCSNNYKKIFNWISSIKIYRGVVLNSSFGYVNTNIGRERTSANTDNYYTLLLDNLPSWKKYPKRSRGLVCSTDKMYAENYGGSFYIIPYDNAKIGVCPTFDIWDSFKNSEFGKYFYDLDDLNVTINKIILTAGLYTETPKNYNQLKDILIQISNLTNDEWRQTGLVKKWKFFKQKDIMKHLNDVMSPNKNGFKMGIENLKKEREVWIQGESIVLSYKGKAMLEKDIQNYFWG